MPAHHDAIRNSAVRLQRILERRDDAVLCFRLARQRFPNNLGQSGFAPGRFGVVPLIACRYDLTYLVEKLRHHGHALDHIAQLYSEIIGERIQR